MMEITVRDIGSGKWPEGPYMTWVNKLDVVQYLRCQYKIYMAHNLSIPYDAFITPAAMEALVNPGVEFEQTAVPTLAVEEGMSIQESAREEVLLRSHDLIRNHDLGLQGVPDLVATEKGKLIPIEVKSHKTVIEADKIELAFYWRLLEPLRTRRAAKKGYIMVNTGEFVEVKLTDRHFIRLEEIIAQIRRLREEGTELVIVKECKNCTFKEEHAEAVRGAGGLSLIQDIGSSRQTRLKSLGVDNIRDLAVIDIQDLYTRWRAEDRYSPTVGMLRQMQAHAQAFLSDEPRYIGDGGFPFVDQAVLLDLEYDPSRLIFLIGAHVFENGQIITKFQWFSAEKTDERQILEAFCEFICRLPEHWLLTWNGLAADIPQFKSAWRRHTLDPQILDKLCERHIDLYQVARDNVRLPITGLGLGPVANYFGYNRKYPSVIGLEIPLLYYRYLMARNDANKASIKAQILTHNYDDLESLSLVWNRLDNIVLQNMVEAGRNTGKSVRGE
jgi:predicted RecB family nuclease